MSQAVGGGAGAGAERMVVLWFTDVKGSTRRWDQYPQHMAGALRCLDVTVENAVFLVAVGATPGMPFVVELGISFDVILAVLILGVLVHRIVDRFESMDVSRLSKLKG